MRSLCLLCLLVAVLVGVVSADRLVPHGRSLEWGYGKENGPNTWPFTFPTCGGANQSPVALHIATATAASPSMPLLFKGYNVVPTSMTITNTGHAVQVNQASSAAVAGGDLVGEYTFAQFHFHWGSIISHGSEHTIDNVRFPAEIHMVHYKTLYGSMDEALKYKDGVAVLSILLHVSLFDNPRLQPIIDGLARIQNPQEETAIKPFALQDVLPHNIFEFFRYQGSLTTPACNEVVVWTVFKHSIPISFEQVDQFRQLVAMDSSSLMDNFRPTQPLNGRTVYAYGCY